MSLSHAVHGGCVKAGLIVLFFLAANVARAQFSFAGAEPVSGEWGSVTNDNTGVIADPSPPAPLVGGFYPNAPLWYTWTAPRDGEVQLDTMGSSGLVTNIFFDGINYTTNVSPSVVDTVVSVYTGNNLSSLNQVSANDDLYPYPQYNYSSGQNIYWINTNNVPPAPVAEALSVGPYYYNQPYSGPSGLRFNAKAGTTYYIEVDSKLSSYLLYGLTYLPTAPTGPIVLNWAYKSSGVFRFASEELDQTGIVNTNTGTPMLLYRAAETETSRRWFGTVNADQFNSTVNTYYPFNVAGMPVTITRVAGSSGRVMVDYTTMDGDTNLITNGDQPAVAYLDYAPVSGTLIFDDFEMSKTIYIPIYDDYGVARPNRDFFVVLSNAVLDPYEDSSAVSPPRVDPDFGIADVRILDADVDPKSVNARTEIVTNGFDVNTNPILATNTLYTYIPTNAVFNFMKANYRITRDATNWWGTGTKISVLVTRTGTNTGSASINWILNSEFLSKNNPQYNYLFPLQPGSDYATPDPATIGNIAGTNSDFHFSATSGTLSWGNDNFDPQPISFLVYNNGQAALDEDFRLAIYDTDKKGHPIQPGMISETTVTILANRAPITGQTPADDRLPAGSVDENWNPDFGLNMAPPVNTTPQQNPNPGTDLEVDGLAILPNDETMLVGSFHSYNGVGRNGIALVNTDGSLDQSFNPGSGVNDTINAVAATANNQFIIGGAFTSYNGTSRNRIARINRSGSLDNTFNPGLGADGNVWAVAVQPDGKVIIGGEFTHINGVTRNYLARLNSDGSLDTTFDPSTTLNGPVYALSLPKPSLITTNRISNGVVHEDDVTLNVPANNTGTITVNYDFIETNEMQIYYAGVLIYDTGPRAGAQQIAVPYGPGGTPITLVVNPSAALPAVGWGYGAVVTSGSSTPQVVAGGDFSVSGQTYKNIARFNVDGTLDTTFDTGFGADNPIYAVATQPNGKVLAGGNFTHVNNLSMNRLVRFNADGSLDTTGFYPGTGADDTVFCINYANSYAFSIANGTNITVSTSTGIYIGGQFSSYNGTHRLGFARLYTDGTVNTTFLDTTYNQFAGLPKIYSYDAPGVYACGVQSDGGIIIGGHFSEVGGGQADKSVRDQVDQQLGIAQSFADPNLWVSMGGQNVEPNARDGVRNRNNVARLIGGATPGPGNLTLVPDTSNGYSANRNQGFEFVTLIRTNGFLGPLTANFSIQPGTALSGQDFSYQALDPMFWLGWEYAGPSRMHSDGLAGISGYLNDKFGRYFSGGVASLSQVYVTLLPDSTVAGNLSANYSLANPTLADQLYLGGEDIPVGGALGISSSPVSLIDNNQKAGTFGFVSSEFIATNSSPVITVVRRDGSFGTISLNYFTTTNGTALVSTDFVAIPSTTMTFGQNVLTNTFPVSILANGLIATNYPEKSVNLRLSNLRPLGNGAAYGLTNAVLRLINRNFRGYLTLSATNYVGSQTFGQISFTVDRVAGSQGSLSVQYATTNGTAVSGVDYNGATNTLTWNDGDVSPRTVTLALKNPGNVGANKYFYVRLFNPILNAASEPGLLSGVITNATMTISNDNSYGIAQFSATNYIVNENGGYATITVLRSGGIAGPVSVDYATSDGPAVSPANYTNVSGTLVLAAGQVSTNFTVPIRDDGVIDPADFYFNVALSNPTGVSLGSWTNAQVHIVDAQTYNQPPGSPDPGFNPGEINGDVLALALQSDGKILAAGNFTQVGNVLRNHIARLNTDGSLDTGFLNNLSGALGPVNAVVSQTDGRILIGGAFNSVNGVHLNFVARLMTDGTIDTSFNPGAGADSAVYALAETFIGGARKIYVGGAFGSLNSVSSPGVIRLSNDGTVDTGFNAGSGADGAVYAIATYPTNSIYAGKVLIGGAFKHYNGVSLNGIARLNADGSVDVGFSAGATTNSVVNAISIQPDGRVLVGGSFTNFNGAPVNRIVRLNGDGSTDTNFVANVGAGANSTVEAIHLQPDNRIVLVGQFTSFNGLTRNHITRLLSNGKTDPTINFGTGANGDVDSVVLQPADNMLVIGGAFSQYDDQPHSHIARIYGGSATGSGAFTFTAADFYANENGIVAPITILRTGGTSGTNADGSGDVFVRFITSDDTATNGINYLGVTNTVDFPPGEVLKTVTVPVLDDFKITPDLIVDLALTNATPPATNGVQPVAQLHIVNVDSAVSFSSAFYTQAKNVLTGLAPIDILRTGGTNGTATVDFYTTTNGTAVAGTDYYPTNVTVTFHPGESDVQVQVPIINNNMAEGNTTVGLALSNSVNAFLISPSNAVLTIIDTVTAPGQLHFGDTNVTVTSGDGTAYVPVLRTNGTSGSVSVTYTTVPGTAQPGLNYNSTVGSVTFGNGESIKYATVTLPNNHLAQGPVNFSLFLSNPTGGATLADPTNATVTILSTNVGFAFLNATNYIRETNGVAPVFVQRIGSTNGAVSVNFSTTNNGTAQPGVNYDSVSGTLAFGPNEVLKTISLPLHVDPRVTGDLTLGMKLSNPTPNTFLISPSNSLIVIQDADAGLSFTNSAMNVYKNAGSAIVTVVCSNPSVEPVVTDTNVVPLSVSYSTSDGSAVAGVDYTAVTGTLIFTNGIGTNTFAVPIINNSLVTGDHSFNVHLFNPTAPGQLVAPSNQVVTIVDNNSGLSFSSPYYTVLKTGVAATITVVRTDNTNQVSSVNFATADGSANGGTDYFPTNGVLVFTNGETSKSFNVRVIANSTVQPDKTVLLQLFDPANAFLMAPYAATLTIHDTSGSLVVPAGSTLVHESLVTNGIIDPGENVTMLLALRASGGTNIPAVYATLLTTNGISSPSPSTPVGYGSMVVNGPSTSRQFSFTANGTNGQQVAATLLINNGSTNIGTAVFTYTLGMWTNTFYNTNSIIINPNSIASPYPSDITVSNLGGTLVQSVVTLTNVYHTYPQFMNVLLVSPAGKDVLLMSHAGGSTNVSKITLTFEDGAANSLPLSNALTTSTNKPTKYYSTPIFP